MKSSSHSAPFVIVAIGHSVRALVSAIRGLQVLRCLAVDYYGDADTREMATEGWLPLAFDSDRRICSETVTSITAILNQCQYEGLEVVVLLAGGMENHPDALEQLSSIGRVLAPSSAAMRDLRDRNFWRSAARASGIQFPETRDHDCQEVDLTSDQWLWKPTMGAGGVRIKRACFVDQANLIDGYWQRIIEGRSIGVTCVISESVSRILGSTEGLSSKHWPAPSEFIYRGSVGPIVLAERSNTRIIKLCDYIRDRFGACGWLQFDFVQDSHQQLWLVECNPRWTAGMEILVESGVNPVSEHLAAWGYAISESPMPKSHRLSAKAIVYATKDLAVEAGTFAKTNAYQTEFSDIPFGPQQIEKDSPIATVKTWIDQECPMSYDQKLEQICIQLNELRVKLLSNFE